MIYTIGYSDYDYDEFIKVLKQYNINYLFDVRSSPFSTNFKDYNKPNLNKHLPENDITYIYIGDKLGGRPKDKTLYSNNVVDYSKVALSDSFKKGIGQIIEFKDSNICLMCTEKRAINCHRSILLGRVLSALGLSVLHIEKEIPLLSQRDIELMLKKIYFPDDGQMSLFDENNSYEFQISESYKMQNKKIGSLYFENE